MNKKVGVTKEQMVEAVKANGKEPWKVLGLGRTNWFRNLSKNGVNMTELRESSKENVQVQHTEVQTRKVNPVPQWSPEVTNESNAVGRPRGVGGVRYRYTDTEKYNEFKKEDAFHIMEREVKNEITHKPTQREIKPEIPEELLQYDQTDVPYEVWNKYIDASKGEHWGTFVMKYGRWLEPKKHNSKEDVEKRTSEKLGLEYFEKYLGKGGRYNPSRDSYIINGEENFF